MRKKVSIALVGCALVFCFIPIKVYCGVPDAVCARPDTDSLAFDMEPAIIYVLEKFLGSDIPVKYYQGY